MFLDLVFPVSFYLFNVAVRKFKVMCVARLCVLRFISIGQMSYKEKKKGYIAYKDVYSYMFRGL